MEPNITPAVVILPNMAAVAICTYWNEIWRSSHCDIVGCTKKIKDERRALCGENQKLSKCAYAKIA